MTAAIGRPAKNEYAESYEGYVSLVDETDIVSTLTKQLDEVKTLFSQISDEKALYAYAKGKWTIKEILGHLIDGERVFSYRALRISRKDETPIPGFDQDPYVANANSNAIPLADLLQEFLSLRESNCLFFKNLSDDAWTRTGIACDAKVSVRALAYMLVGHIRHHVKILKERYLIG